MDRSRGRGGPLKILVVGGGLAGLTSAVAAADRGLRPTVVEREPILGGRARSWPDPVTGDPVHIGPHIVISEYPNFFALLERLGTRGGIVWQPDRFLTLVDGTRASVLRAADLPAPYHFLPSLLAAPEVRKRDLVANWPVTQMAMSSTEADFARLDGVNAYALLRAMGVPQPFIDWFWRFVSFSILNVPLELCSAGALLRFYRLLVGLPDIGIGFVDGGLGDIYAPQAKAAIESAGGVVHTDATVVELLGDAGRVTGARLADGRVLHADTVVLAMPPAAIRRLVREEWLAHPVFHDLSAFFAVPYVCTYLWFDRRLTDLQFWARRFRAADLNCDFYDYANIYTSWKGRNSMIGSNIIWSHRAEHLDDEAVIRRTRAELAEFLPESATAKLVHAAVNRVPTAIHCPYPGTERVRPEVRTQIRGLYFSGDWVNTGFPYTMEGATRSGWMVAEAVLADAGRPESLARAWKEPVGLPAFFQKVPKFPTWRMGRWAGRL